VVDTIEVAGRWSVLAELSAEVVGALKRLEGTLTASVHQSHAYPDGACLYFTFAGRHPEGSEDPETLGVWQEAYYRSAWETALRPVLERGAAISHHHGVGLNRGRFLEASLGTSFAVLRAVKDALDPRGILNPGKLGLDSPFGPPPWP
jgi:alkyldihydroxyacetonephosphate synthase